MQGQKSTEEKRGKQRRWEKRKRRGEGEVEREEGR